MNGKKAGLILVRKKREKMDDKPLTLEFVEWHKKNVMIFRRRNKYKMYFFTQKHYYKKNKQYWLRTR